MLASCISIWGIHDQDSHNYMFTRLLIIAHAQSSEVLLIFVMPLVDLVQRRKHICNQELQSRKPVSTESIAMVPKKKRKCAYMQPGTISCEAKEYSTEAASLAKDSLQRQQITDNDPSSPRDVHQ